MFIIVASWISWLPVFCHCWGTCVSAKINASHRDPSYVFKITEFVKMELYSNCFRWWFSAGHHLVRDVVEFAWVRWFEPVVKIWKMKDSIIKIRLQQENMHLSFNYMLFLYTTLLIYIYIYLGFWWLRILLEKLTINLILCYKGMFDNFHPSPVFHCSRGRVDMWFFIPLRKKWWKHKRWTLNDWFFSLSLRCQMMKFINEWKFKHFSFKRMLVKRALNIYMCVFILTQWS